MTAQKPMPSLWKPKPSWQEVAARARARIDNAIPSSYLAAPEYLPKTPEEYVLDLPERSGVLSARELEITGLNAWELLPKLADKSFSAVEVTEAFCRRASVAHQVTNCLALVMFKSALERAKELDEYLERTGKPIGPLHGLPISIKEHIEVEGTPATAGFIAWVDDVSKNDALVVKILRDAGAIFHVKTANPQALMSIETDSNIYGRTTNPYNRNLSSGGSSGGEGSLLAMRGSALGIGTDMGGSIRVPASFSGIYGLKPAIARNPHGGLAGNYGGMESIVGVVGPLTHCVKDLRLFQEVVLASEPWNIEPSLVRMPWNPEGKDMQLPKKLKIGIIWDDGVVQPHPPITRALKTTVDALKSSGHEIIDWDTSLHDDIQSTVWQMFFLDGGKEVFDVFREGNEGPVKCIEFALRGGPYSTPRHYTVEESWKINSERTKQQTAYASMWNETGVDFIIAPSNPAAATAHDETGWDGYTGVWNGLDHTAVVFPVTSVQQTDTYENFPRLRKEPLGERDLHYIDAYKNGPSKYANAPVALQLITRKHTEEKALKAVELVEGIIGSSR
ncbi:hypothetical protein HYALB_00012498 [Hymenoscyphus albidus]|uniref:amidase n=1 Tax=Hymenoscyphus albidus TaxID=595503 RepID=A0A9N9Q9A2_9HELO|nr:hypothetical protein HYALB_00012498 [Hymenoscyphus albidus]